MIRQRGARPSRDAVPNDDRPKARPSRRFAWHTVAAVVMCTAWLLKVSEFLHQILQESSSAARDVHAHSIEKDEQVNTQNSNNTCAWYLAPSSIPGAGGLGVFTARRIAKGSRLFENVDGPTVVIQDPDLHQGDLEWVQNPFMWRIRRHYYKESDSCWETSPNLGVMVNHHDVLENTRVDRVDEQYDDSILNRFTDPGAGAISYHTGRYFTATRNIAPLEELFTFDGESYIRHHIRKAGGDVSSIPSGRDYHFVGDALMSLVEKAKKDGNKVDDALLSKLHSHVSSNSSRAASLLPRSAQDLSNILKIWNGEDYLNNGQIVARHNLMDRSLEWMEQHGRCLDNVVPGRSNIPQAGQGAIATRFLTKGSVVVPVPLLVQVVDKKTLEMYKLLDAGNGTKKKTGTVIGHQILMNYCYGHERSSLLLCAGSNANLINHCKADNGPCKKGGPNAKLRWARDFDPNTSNWLTKSLEEIRELVLKGQRGLTLEVVATRDIQPGEEVFLDYGTAWEEAWTRHVERWKPPTTGSGFESFASVVKMNRNGKAPVKTENELKTEPYPANIETLCKHWDGKYYPCVVVERNDSSSTPDSIYTARITHLDRQGNEDKQEDIKTNLQRSDIMFSMKKYSSDEHLPGAFRHFIGVPDDMWPEQWKDLGP